MATPSWMRPLLLAAATYNILWGTWAVAFPHAIFHWCNIAPPLYPQLWQCIGMIVAVYGVGYAIAAFDPARHWPIILVGLLGKILGPIGMAAALWQGTLPLPFVLTCITNDLIWWLPFSLILAHAYAQARHAQAVAPAPPLPAALRQAISSHGVDLLSLSSSSPLLLIFLRHSGCIFCREALQDLSAQRAQIEAAGCRIALVHMSPPAEFERLAARYGLADVPALSDPGRSLYQAFQLHLATPPQILQAAVWQRGLEALLRGHRAGAPRGHPLQMPGAFLIHDGQILKAFRHPHSAARPAYLELAKPPSKA